MSSVCPSSTPSSLASSTDGDSERSSHCTHISYSSSRGFSQIPGENRKQSMSTKDFMKICVYLHWDKKCKHLNVCPWRHMCG